MLVCRDIDQEKRATEKAAEVRAKDQFLAVLSHELRTPLTPVLATVALLQKDERLDADTREQLALIRRNAEMEARLIEDLLDVTRIVRGKLQMETRLVDLCEVIKRAVEVCMPDIENRKLEFSLEVGGGPYWLNGDAIRLQQAFWNLLKNAIKFTPNRGRVSLCCRRQGGHAIAEVSDSGVGIKPELIGGIFRPFDQGDSETMRQFGGLGLGLAICKGIVEMHGGTIEAHSEGEGKGATFRVTLPLYQGEASERKTTDAASSGAAAAQVRSLRILLVEDHGDTARIMRRLLTMAGHEVQTAGNVATALELARSGSFDLLISDLGLPDSSGLDLMRELRRRGSKLPGIALSGYAQENDIRRSQEAGFAIHLTKPTSPERVVEAIARIKGMPSENAKSGY